MDYLSMMRGEGARGYAGFEEILPIQSRNMRLGLNSFTLRILVSLSVCDNLCCLK